MLFLPLILVLFGCGSGLLGAVGSPVPAEMQGQWQTNIAGPPDLSGFLDPGIVDPPPYGQNARTDLGIGFYFFPNGRYQRVLIYKISYLYTCILVQQWYEEGAVRIEGSSFSFYPSKATLSKGGNCAGTISNSPVQGQPFTLTITPDQDQTGWPLLHLGYPGGDLLLEKCRDCK